MNVDRMVVNTKKQKNCGYSNNAKVEINNEMSCNRKQTIEHQNLTLFLVMSFNYNLDF